MLGAMNSKTKETKYTARRSDWGNTSLYKGTCSVDVGWLPDAFAHSTQSYLAGAGHKTLRVVTLEKATDHFAVDSYEAWHALFHAAGDFSRFTIFAK